MTMGTHPLSCTSKRLVNILRLFSNRKKLAHQPSIKVHEREAAHTMSMKLNRKEAVIQSSF